MKKIRVLIVDDSALVRKVLKEILSGDEALEVVGTASDAWSAMQRIKEWKPDVVTLDIVMPGMDGLDFLERLMKSNPLPVVMLSTLTSQESEQTFRALSLGAVDVLAKPTLDVREKLDEMAELIIDRVKAAGQAQVRNLPHRFLDGPRSVESLVRRSVPVVGMAEPVIAIGASTGGTDALQEVLAPLPEDTPAILVVQHMMAHFTAPFAQRLDRVCRMRVKEAVPGDRVQAGTVLVAPGGRHMEIVREGDRHVVQMQDGPMVHRVRPSVDVLFHSMATQVGRRGIGVILTGMGADGAEGLLAMKRAGARTLAQDEASCVVFGMPKMAIKAGGVDEVLPVLEIPGRLLALLEVGDG